jgi:hypothetical protein
VIKKDKILIVRDIEERSRARVAPAGALLSVSS